MGTVATPTSPSNTSCRKVESTLRIPTPTRWPSLTADTLPTTWEPPSLAPRGSASVTRVTLRGLLLWSLSPLPSTPPTTPSSCTQAVSTTSPTAPATPSTTVSWLLDMVARPARTTGLSRTLGALSGERPDTSRCPREGTTSVALPPWLATPRLNHPVYIILILYTMSLLEKDVISI